MASSFHDVKEDNKLRLLPGSDQPKDFTNYLRTNIQLILASNQEQWNEIYGVDYSDETSHHKDDFATRYCNLHHSNIYAVRMFSHGNPLSTLEAIGAPFQELRDEQGPHSTYSAKRRAKTGIIMPGKKREDYFAVRSFLETGTSNRSTIKKATFGLPIAYSYRSLGRLKPGNKASVTSSNEKVERSASSFLIGVTGFFNHSIPTIVDFHAELLPKGQSLQLEDKTKPPKNGDEDPGSKGKTIRKFEEPYNLNLPDREMRDILLAWFEEKEGNENRYSKIQLL
jgi:hypothetical protein